MQAAKSLAVASKQGYSIFVCACLQTQSTTELNQKLTKARWENAWYGEEIDICVVCEILAANRPFLKKQEVFSKSLHHVLKNVADRLFVLPFLWLFVEAEFGWNLCEPLTVRARLLLCKFVSCLSTHPLCFATVAWHTATMSWSVWSTDRAHFRISQL